MNKAIPILLVILSFTAGSVHASDFSAHPGYKSPSTATGMALLGTTVPVALMFLAASESSGSSDSGGLVLMGLVGSIFGPGLGHSYAGENGRFWSGAGWRTLAWSSLVVAVAISWDDTDSSSGAFLAVGGAALYLVSTVYDIATASDSADRHNEKLESREVTLIPLWSPQDNSVGLGVSLGF